MNLLARRRKEPYLVSLAIIVIIVTFLYNSRSRHYFNIRQVDFNEEITDKGKQVDLANLLQSLSAGFLNVEAHFVNNQSVREGAIVDTSSQAGFDLTVVTRLLSNSSNRHFRFALAGGSIAQGCGLRKYTDRFYSLISKQILDLLKPLGFTATFTDLSEGGKSSFPFAMCVHEYVDLSQIDFFLLEFSYNDFYDMFAMEELVRSIRRRNPTVHIIYVQMYHPAFIFKTHSICQKGSVRPFQVDTIVPQYLQIAKHYKLGFITMGDYFAKLGYDREMSFAERSNASRLYGSYGGNAHPGEVIHQLIAEGILTYFSNSFRKLASRIEGNTARQEDFLALREQFKQSAVDPPLFASTWIDDTDCFSTIGMERPQVIKDTLASAFVHSESSSASIVRARGFDRVVFPLEGNGRKMSFDLKTQFSKDHSPCSIGYIPRLAIEHDATLNGCTRKFSPTKFGVKAVFRFGNKTIPVKYEFRSPVKLYNVRRLAVFDAARKRDGVPKIDCNGNIPEQFKAQELRFNFSESFPLNMGNDRFPLMRVRREDKYYAEFCAQTRQSPILDSLSLTIEDEPTNETYRYPLELRAIMIGYDCCH